jgi:hypothetical protein
MPQSAFCTIVTRSHLRYAMALGRGLERYHPDFRLCILAIDFVDETTIPRTSNVEVIKLDDLSIPDISDMEIYFSPFELSNALKPFWLCHLIRRGFEHLIYLDADIFVVGKFDQLFQLLDQYELVLSPIGSIRRYRSKAFVRC